MANWEDFKMGVQDSLSIRHRVCIQIAHDFIAGHALWHIVYWNLPGRGAGSEETKLRAKKTIGGVTDYCLARSGTDAFEKIGITDRQWGVALKKLAKLKLIKTKVMNFDAHGTTHIWLNRDLFASEYIKAKEALARLKAVRKEKQAQEKSKRAENLSKRNNWRVINA